MRDAGWDDVVDAATAEVRRYLASLPDRPVWRDAGAEAIRAALPPTLPETGSPAADVVAALARALDPHLTAMSSGRFFGFVIGGLHPAALGAQILVDAWNQNAGLYAPTPGAAVAEEVACEWLLDLLRLPAGSSVALVTGGQMATFTGLAAGRDAVLREAGWDVEADGLQGAPRMTVVTKGERHSTVPRALRYLGLGYEAATPVACDEQDRIRPDALAATLERIDGPTLVCLEAGNINTGAFDPFHAAADAVEAHRARGNPTWTHVDGAVGLWALAAGMDEETDGLQRLDSWSTDAHKLLNAGYDCGITICRSPAPHRAAMSVRASYLVQGTGAREPMDWTPEFSRRARGVVLNAVLQSLGRQGVAELVGRARTLARRFADALAESGRAGIENTVVFNQVLVRWEAPEGMDPDAVNDGVMAEIQRDGTAFLSGTTWRGHRLMRISVSDWATDEDDVDRTVAALLAAHERVVGRAS